MFRHRSGNYEVHTTKRPETDEYLRQQQHHPEPHELLDFRVDMADRMTMPKAAFNTSKMHMSMKTRAPPPSSLSLMPSAIPNGLKRCQSASTVRRKLQHAVEQSSQSYQEQITALRTLGIGSLKQQTPKTLLTRQSDASRAHESPAPRSNQHSAADNTRVKPATPKATRRPSGSAATPAVYKSNTVQMEVELAEKLNDIERSKFNEKAEARFTASQKAFDLIIQHDEPFGRVLAKIRDEYHAYMTFLTQDIERTLLADDSPGDQRRSTGTLSNNHHNDIDVGALQRENATLKRQCAAMQREIDTLHGSIRALTTKGKKNGGEPQDDDLIDVPLCRDIDNACTKRPLQVPRLDFSCLSPYCEEEDEEDDCNDDLS